MRLLTDTGEHRAWQLRGLCVGTARRPARVLPSFGRGLGVIFVPRTQEQPSECQTYEHHPCARPEGLHPRDRTETSR